MNIYIYIRVKNIVNNKIKNPQKKLKKHKNLKLIAQKIYKLKKNKFLKTIQKIN